MIGVEEVGDQNSVSLGAANQYHKEKIFEVIELATPGVSTKHEFSLNCYSCRVGKTFFVLYFSISFKCFRIFNFLFFLGISPITPGA